MGCVRQGWVKDQKDIGGGMDGTTTVRLALLSFPVAALCLVSWQVLAWRRHIRALRVIKRKQALRDLTRPLETFCTRGGVRLWG